MLTDGNLFPTQGIVGKLTIRLDRTTKKYDIQAHFKSQFWAALIIAALETEDYPYESLKLFSGLIYTHCEVVLKLTTFFRFPPS